MTTTARRSRTTALLLAGAAVVLLVVAGGGVVAVQALSGGGQQPEEVLPADTLVYVELDLDPPGTQKVALSGTGDRLGLPDDVADLGAVVRELGDEDGRGLDWERDVEPWAGARLGVAVVDLGDDVTPVLAVQADDVDEARAVLAEAADTHGAEFADEVRGEYVLITVDDDHLRRALEAAARGTLADSTTYADDLEALGGDRVVTSWADLDAVSGALARADEADAFTEALSGRLVAAVRARGDDVLELEARVRGLPEEPRPGAEAASVELRQALQSAEGAPVLVGLTEASGVLEQLAAHGDENTAQPSTAPDDAAGAAVSPEAGWLVGRVDLAAEAFEVRATLEEPDAFVAELREVLTALQGVQTVLQSIFTDPPAAGLDLDAGEGEVFEFDSAEVEGRTAVLSRGEVGLGGAVDALDVVVADLPGDLTGVVVVTPEPFLDLLEGDTAAVLEEVEAFGLASAVDGDDRVYRARLVLR